jgi:hypothetical protein
MADQRISEPALAAFNASASPQRAIKQVASDRRGFFVLILEDGSHVRVGREVLDAMERLQGVGGLKTN